MTSRRMNMGLLFFLMRAACRRPISCDQGEELLPRIAVIGVNAGTSRSSAFAWTISPDNSPMNNRKSSYFTLTVNILAMFSQRNSVLSWFATVQSNSADLTPSLSWYLAFTSCLPNFFNDEDVYPDSRLILRIDRSGALSKSNSSRDGDGRNRSHAISTSRNPCETLRERAAALAAAPFQYL